MPIFSYSDLYNEKNVPRTREVFCEFSEAGVLTHNRDGKEGKISLYKLYISLAVDDPSEVTFAEEVFGDLPYWFSLQEAPWFKKHIEEWRLVAAEKRKCQAFKAIINEVKSNGKSAFTAAKYLIEEPWRNGNSVAEKKRIKREIEETTNSAYHSKAIKSDIERLQEEGLIN